MNARKLRLLYYVECLGVGGAFQTTVTVAREMKERGHEVVFVSKGGPLRKLLDESRITHIEVDTDVRHPSPTIVSKLVETTNRFKIDLLCPNGFDCTLDAVAAGIWTDRPLVPTYGGMFNLPYPHPRLPIVNAFSFEQMADLVERYGWKREIFRNMIARIDGKRFSSSVTGQALRRELGIREGAPVLVTICRHDRLKLKGLISLLEAAEEIHRSLPDARLVLYGDGNSHEEVLERIRQVHRSVGVEFVLAPGSTNRTAEAFAMADIVLANGARSALEGMAVGRPVVSLGPNGFCGVMTPDTIEGFRRFNFDKGRLAGNPIGDYKNLVASLSRLLRDDKLRKRLAAFSLDYADKNLIIQSVGHEYETMYREGIEIGWGGGLGRLQVFTNWLGVVGHYYGYKLFRRGRAGQCDSGHGGLAPPPVSVDPDWGTGLPHDSNRGLPTS
ncbi:MAG: glycosyltransferase [Acidobacteriota bacterium]|nr:glycosyltransferase [Acidobacteriota bacterium]